MVKTFFSSNLKTNFQKTYFYIIMLKSNKLIHEYLQALFATTSGNQFLWHPAFPFHNQNSPKR